MRLCIIAHGYRPAKVPGCVSLATNGDRHLPLKYTALTTSAALPRGIVDTIAGMMPLVFALTLWQRTRAHQQTHQWP